MKCVDCHYLCVAGRGFPEAGILPGAGRDALRNKQDWLQDEFELSCAKRIQDLRRGPLNMIWEDVLGNHACEAYLPYDPSLTRDQMLQIEVQMPTLYKVAIVIAIAFAFIAAIAAAVAIWHAFW